MVTPTKTEIESKAQELWFEDRLRREGVEATLINPTLEELREEGFIISAQHSLMRDPIANPIAKWVTKEKPKTQVYPLHACMHACKESSGIQIFAWKYSHGKIDPD